MLVADHNFYNVPACTTSAFGAAVPGLREQATVALGA